MRKNIETKVNICEMRWRQLNRSENEGYHHNTRIIKALKYTTTSDAHHSPANAQLLPKQWCSPTNSSSIYSLVSMEFGMDYLSDLFGSAAHAVSLSSSSCAPSAQWQGSMRSWKFLDLATTKPSMCYQHCSHSKSQTQLCTSYWEEN